MDGEIESDLRLEYTDRRCIARLEFLIPSPAVISLHYDYVQTEDRILCLARTESSSSTPPCVTASSPPAAPCTTRKNSAWPTRSRPLASMSSRPDSPSPPTATSRPSERSPARSAAP